MLNICEGKEWNFCGPDDISYFSIWELSGTQTKDYLVRHPIFLLDFLCSCSI
jgi:hypothetical protein